MEGKFRVIVCLWQFALALFGEVPLPRPRITDVCVCVCVMRQPLVMVNLCRDMRAPEDLKLLLVNSKGTVARCLNEAS